MECTPYRRIQVAHRPRPDPAALPHRRRRRARPCPAGPTCGASAATTRPRLYRLDVWFNRDGEQLETITPPGEYLLPVLSPNGRSVAFTRTEPPMTGDPELWVADVERGTNARVATGLGANVSAAWSPDGAGLMFVANRAIQRKLAFRRRVQLGPSVQFITRCLENSPVQ